MERAFQRVERLKAKPMAAPVATAALAATAGRVPVVERQPPKSEHRNVAFKWRPPERFI
jgi:hypothetical protein